MTKEQPDEVSALRSWAHAVRQLTVKTYHTNGSGHYGGSLSLSEILATLYFGVMRIDPSQPRWPDRDRFVLGKGHACGALCAALALRGYFPESDLLATFNKFKSKFGMHPDMNKIPGVDMSTGSLGHGLPVAIGMALAGKLSGKDYRVFVVVGDGECDEGSVWESFMAAPHHKLDNLVVIIDRNKLSMDGPTEQVMALEPFEEKLRAFNWNVQVVDGHDVAQLYAALKAAPTRAGQPTLIIANTVKGKGISFMEGVVGWHYGAMSKDQAAKAYNELGIEVR